MTHHIVVLGAGYAGLMAAKGAARKLRRSDVRITLVNAVGHFVERVRLHQLAAGRPLKDLPLSKLLAGTGIELVVARVTAVDAAARTVQVDSAPHDIPYDTLVYALGSAADTVAVPGVTAHASAVATHQDAVRLRERAAEAQGSLAVAGAGLTGIETATEPAETYPGLTVQLVTGGELGAGLSERGRRYLRAALGRHGVALREHANVAEVAAHGLVLADGSEIPADSVVWTAGFRVPDLAREAGFAVDAHGLLTVDPTLRSASHPEVFAAGDAAASSGPDGAASRMSCQTGLPMGAHVAGSVAASLTGRTPKPLRLRYVWQNISLGRHDGLTQFTRADDSPVAAILTGRASARFKEAVTRSTVLALRR
ncbi:NAD(P)/FAD-dependent oxidoreductase [Streptomyces pinistramenti]|uniref:NAD(P)/FAD-dependent oxidoreductase n=1 Tax=Streptomyces pinistramenti TaxID=2884812 RepID=UPI001D07BA94|nr:FAD-dependent oxidoreductase [Streptomyces pinistramenti]MCB5906354.1 FAD-dependent oxidoreductase [Streptomyces pinistramenti]